MTEYNKQRHMDRMTSDRFVCDLIGIRLTDAGQGYAKAELELKPIHLNGVGIVQGGLLFTIADYVFAAACNYSEEEVVGIETTTSFIKSVRSGKIFAEGQEVSRTKSFTCCEVRVSDEKGRLLALFRGRGFILPPH
ncbi:MAG: PaaI family thioesterase [Planctomycetia bacterium]|nr:PaaI family thioesterase [Planctomycetia bacterium]